MSAWTDFRDGVESKISGAPAPSGNANSNPAMGSIFEALYQYGRGQTETAVQKLTSAFRASATGKKIEAEATKQKIAELMPMILLGVLAIIIGSYFVFRR